MLKFTIIVLIEKKLHIAFIMKSKNIKKLFKMQIFYLIFFVLIKNCLLFATISIIFLEIKNYYFYNLVYLFINLQQKSIFYIGFID